MNEYEVVMHVARHLIQSGWAIEKISVTKKNEREEILRQLGLNRAVFHKKGEDIVATRWKRGRKMLIEAKGGPYKYAIYTALGQMVCSLDDTRYNWYGLAFPSEWRITFQKLIRESEIVRQVIGRSRRKHKSLFFFFVSPDGSVAQETWTKFLKS